MFRGIELILITKQETVVLPRVESTMVECVLVVVKVRYSEPIFNQQNVSIVRGVPMD
jgi:hypothetical protein